jgi:hypothetical protein
MPRASESGFEALKYKFLTTCNAAFYCLVIKPPVLMDGLAIGAFCNDDRLSLRLTKRSLGTKLIHCVCSCPGICLDGRLTSYSCSRVACAGEVFHARQ